MSTMTDTARTTIVPAAHLAYALTAVLPHAAKGDMLPTLACVHVVAKDGRLTLEATDRYTIGEATMPWDGPDVDALLSRPTADALLKASKVEAKRRIGSGTPSVALTFDTSSGMANGDTLEVATDAGRMTMRLDNSDTVGQFPQTTRLWPESTDGLPNGRVGINPAHFLKLDKATSHASHFFALQFNGPTRPVVATPASDWTPDGVTFRALLMLCRLPD